MKRKVMILVLVVACILVAVLPAVAFADGTVYTGTSLYEYTASRTWNKINDKTLENYTRYASLYSPTQVPVGYISTISVGGGNSIDTGENGHRHIWTTGLTGTARLNIKNAPDYAGHRMYTSGEWYIYNGATNRELNY
ncbi:hypothetical protein [Christensenella hongkongensis]|uniref:hypothetical protein n=1 Tax=Christensenella hongkongensis TaxID=270498 RepID=UPI0006231316|nr:hypothetical protein [Christensenella hongkongensis]TCW30659.1 hypothetical protein EV208_102285 [Christensenella hongkongensis]